MACFAATCRLRYAAPSINRAIGLALFAPGVTKQTILLATMTGLHFFAYQAFTGWASTYLKEDRAIPDTVLGDVLGRQSIGAALGGLVWGFVSDRYGRRSAA